MPHTSNHNTSPDHPMRLTRTEAIQDIREMLLALMRKNESVCHAAARLGVFCRGFSMVNFEELKRRFYWIHEEHPGASREEFEHLAEQWLQSIQSPSQGRIACDTLAQRHACCAGWEDFNNAELALFYERLFSIPAQVTPDS